MTNKVCKFGIVGAGMIAEFHAKAIATTTNAELVAMIARGGEQVQVLTQVHACEAHKDVAPFLEHYGLDVVTICSPSGAHLDPTVAAAPAGISPRRCNEACCAHWDRSRGRGCRDAEI